MKREIPHDSWVGDREKYDSIFSEILTLSSDLSRNEEIEEMGFSEDFLTQVVKLTGSALEFLNGKKWGYHIVTALYLKNEMGFTDLSKMIQGVSNRALSTRLKESCEAGLVERFVDVGPPMRTRYSLTEHGRNVATLLTPLVYYMQKQQGILTPENYFSNA